MEFGRVQEQVLDSMDINLPPDPVWNEHVWPGIPSASVKIRIGAARWGQPEWVGRIYPPRTPEKNYLAQYPLHFQALELNATHYKIWDAASVSRWAAETRGHDFLYCPKMFQGITHRGRLAGNEELLGAYFSGLSALGEQLGPIFIQLSDAFTADRLVELTVFLESLPKDLSFFLELRHPGWFADKVLFSSLAERLRHLRTGLVITDTVGRKDCAHMYMPVPKAFIRFVGYDMHPTDLLRMDQWIRRFAEWAEKGVQEIFLMLHMGDSHKEPEMAAYIAEQLDKYPRLQAVKPVFRPAIEAGENLRLFD